MEFETSAGYADDAALAAELRRIAHYCGATAMPAGLARTFREARFSEARDLLEAAAAKIDAAIARERP